MSQWARNSSMARYHYNRDECLLLNVKPLLLGKELRYPYEHI